MRILEVILSSACLLGCYPAVGAVADRFDYPIGNHDRYTEANDGDGWYVAQEFGEWSSDYLKYHLGEDWNAESGGNTDCGSPVYAVANGTIVYASIASGWGRVLIVRHALPDGSQVESLYGHLGSFAKTSGDVAWGEQIGTIGDGSEGGVTYACHLHLELRTAVCTNWGQAGPGYSITAKPVGWVDPSDYIDSHRQVGGLNDGLVAYYPFNGNANDASGNGHDGVLLNGASLTQGITGLALWVNSAGQSVEIRYSPEMVASNYSIGAWVMPLTELQSSQNVIFAQNYGHAQLVARPGSTGVRVALSFGVNHGTFYDVVSTNEIPIGQLTHLMGTWDGQTLRLYLNGGLNAHAALAVTPVDSGCSFGIGGFYFPSGGACSYSGQFFNGIIDEARYYNRCLSASEVADLFAIESREGGPRITAQPQGQLAQGGSKVDLAVSASGAPPLYYQWLFKGQNIAGATSSALTRASVTAADSGEYSVVVRNAYGSVTSATAHLSVLADGANGTQPVRPTGGEVAAPTPSQDSMVVVTHGWYPLWELAPTRRQWVTDLCEALGARVPTNWLVAAYDWIIPAWTLTPDQARFNARIIGGELGGALAKKKLKGLHLIAHSAGSDLIESAARVVRWESPETIIQCTFLDPFTGVIREGRGYYGQSAHWADNYFVHDFKTDALPTLGSFLRPAMWSSTGGPLNYAYNVDVGAAFPGAVVLPTYTSGEGVTAGSTPASGGASPQHDSACQFYISTVLRSGLPCTEANDYGYAFSQEAGGWGDALAHAVHNDPPFGLCSCPIFSQGAAPVAIGPVLPLEELPNASSPGGACYLDGGGARLSAGGAMKDGARAKDAGTGTWMALGVTITSNVNFVQCEVGFGGTNGGDGLLTVYWNTNEIGMLDQRVEPAGLQPHLLMLPTVVSEGCYTLSFRLDSSTNATSVIITNVVTGLVGVGQPSRLEVVSMGGNHGPTVKLRAAAGYNYLVQTSSNLTDWAPMALLVNTNGVVLFTDPTATNASTRFYRAVMP